MPSPLISGSPNLYYDEGLIFGGYHEPSKVEFADVIPRPKHHGVVIKFFDAGKNLRWRCTSNCAFSPILNLEFELTRKGCGTFKLELLYQPKRMPDGVFNHGSWMEIYLWGDKKPIYSGIANRLPGEGTTKRTITMQGIGFVDFVRRELLIDGQDRVVQKLENTTVWAGVATFASILESISFTRYTPSKLQNDPTIYGYNSYDLNEIVYIATPFDEALDELAILEGGWEWGVDADRDLFFRPPSPCLAGDHRLVQGEDFQKWEPVEDSSKILNFCVVQNGKTIEDSTPSVATRFGTNILQGWLEDSNSRQLYGTHAKVISAPNIYSDIDANRYGQSKIQELKNPKVRGYSANVVYRGTKFMPGECFEIVIPHKGVTVLLPLVRARYKLRRGGIFQVDLRFSEEQEGLVEWAADLETKRAVSTAEQRTRRYADTVARNPL